ncbi:MAG: hypothetical protein AB1529_06870 [Candidatus Micrarchaeota archaeon]
MDGHLGLRELLLVGLLIVGLAAAVFLLFGGRPATPAAPEPPPEEPAAAPEDEAPLAAAPEEPSQAEPEAEANVTNKSVGQLLDEGVLRADSRFYQEVETGKYDIKAYQWALGSFGMPPDSVPLKENDLRASSVRFDGRYEDSLRGFGFKTYQPQNLSGPPRIYGTAVFLSSPGPLPSGKFDVEFDPHPEGTQIIEDCTVLTSEELQTGTGAAFTVYDISCKIMYGAFP